MRISQSLQKYGPALNLFFRLFALFLVPQIVVSALIVAKTDIGDPRLLLRFPIEALSWAALGTAILLFRNQLARVFFALYLLLYIAVMVTQFISFDSTFSFVPRIAFENAENAHLFWTFHNISIMALGAGLYAGFLYLALRMSRSLASSHKWLPAAFVASIVVFVSIDTPTRHYIQNLKSQQNSKNVALEMFESAAPAWAMSSMIKSVIVGRLHQRQHRHQALKAGGLLASFNLSKAYPFLKNEIYKTPEPFPRRREGQKQNLLLIFIEGLSARTVSYYDKTFADLTPNITRFANEDSSLAFTNYYNHTAATYTGLLGDLCSLYPSFVENQEWRTKKQATYFCLGHLLKNNSYSTAFLDPHPPEGDYLHDMLEHLGFEQVLTAPQIAALLPVGKRGAPATNLRNKQLFDGLYEYVKSRDESTPFFVATYAFETHAWMDTAADGLKYRDGKNNALNTIKEMDAQFGAFWEKFKKLPAYKNTLVVFTTDHAHYHENTYVQALSDAKVEDYRGYFIDRIPLIFHDPSRKLPRSFDAHFSSSLNLTPTIAHFMGIPNQENPFLGTSIFERKDRQDVATVWGTYYRIGPSGVTDITSSQSADDQAVRGLIDDAESVVAENRVWPSAQPKAMHAPADLGSRSRENTGKTNLR